MLRAGRKALLAVPQQEEEVGDTALALLGTTQKMILFCEIPEHSGSEIKKHFVKLIPYLILALISKLVLEKRLKINVKISFL